MKTRYGKSSILQIGKIMSRATDKHKRVRAVKFKPKALRHFKVDNVSKIDETV